MRWMLITALIVFLTQETVHAVTYKKPGDTVVLSPGSVGATITSVTWKHNSNLAAEWYGAGATDFYRDFRGRCTLKTETGELTIPKLTLKDSGSYTPEINNRVLGTTEIKIILPLPKPTISMSCDDKKTHCVLTCEGNTTDSEPVTYSWWSGDKKKTETKELNITKEETSSFFRCTMENPVSSQFSNQVVNPVLVSNTDNPNMYKKVGDRLDLSVSSKDATITSIVWKHGSNVVVEWNGGEPVVYGDFKGRCTLDSRTGELTISGLKPKDSGSYTAEINGDAITTTKIKVIYEVPKPTISMSCDKEKTHCVLTCEGNTTGVEPVTYTWKSGDVVKSQTKEFTITKNDTEASFVCTVKNPVSSESSKAVNNPLTTNYTPVWKIILPVLSVILVVGVGVIVFYKYKRNRELGHNKIEFESMYIEFNETDPNINVPESMYIEFVELECCQLMCCCPVDSEDDRTPPHAGKKTKDSDDQQSPEIYISDNGYEEPKPKDSEDHIYEKPSYPPAGPPWPNTSQVSPLSVAEPKPKDSEDHIYETNTSQVSPLSVAEDKTLLHGNNGEVQASSSSPGTVNETESPKLEQTGTDNNNDTSL